MEDTLTIIVQVIVGVGGIAGITSLFLVRAQKRKLVAESGKTDAEADAQFSEAYHRRAQTQISLIEPYEKMTARLQKEIDEQAVKIDEQDEWIGTLTDFIEVLAVLLREKGLEVPPMPKKVKNGSVQL